MAYQSKAPTNDWQSPLLTDRKGLRQQHESGRLHGCFIDGRFQQDGWKPQAHHKRSDGFAAYGGGGNQRVGPGGWADEPTRLDGIGAIDLWIDGVRWREVDGEWQPVEEAPRKRANG